MSLSTGVRCKSLEGPSRTEKQKESMPVHITTKLATSDVQIYTGRINAPLQWRLGTGDSARSLHVDPTEVHAVPQLVRAKCVGWHSALMVMFLMG